MSGADGDTPKEDVWRHPPMPGAPVPSQDPFDGLEVLPLPGEALPMDYEGGPTSSQDGPLAPLLPDQAKILQLTQEWSQSPEGLLCQLIQLADPGELAFVLSLIGDPLRQRFFALARSLDLQPPASQGLDEIFLLWLRIKKA